MRKLAEYLKQPLRITKTTLEAVERYGVVFLKQDGIALERKLTRGELLELVYAVKSRLRCLNCDPANCDGWIYKLEIVGNEIRGQWKYCAAKLAYDKGLTERL